MSNQPKIETDIEPTKSFLATHPELSAHIPAIEDAIALYFAVSELHHDLYQDPETDEQQLVIEITTSDNPEDTLEKVRRFDREWWIPFSQKLNNQIVVNVGF